MPVVRYSGEGGSHWNLESIVVQVDSVLPADGWRPARRAQNRSSHKKAQKTQKVLLLVLSLLCFFVAKNILSYMEQELNFRIILESPPAGVDFGLQKGGGRDFEVVQKQRSKTGDLIFEFSARVKEGKDGEPVA